MIDEEIELVWQELLIEQDDGGGDLSYGGDNIGYTGGYGGDYMSYGGGGGGYGANSSGGDYHGIRKLVDPNTLTGLMLSPVRDVWNAVKIAGAKAGTQLVGLAGFLIGGTIAALLPFNDPRTVTYIAKRIQFWEQKNLEMIDKQFEKELALMKDGWDLFKTDFWGIGFIASPMGAIAAAATLDFGVDVGMSVLNVVTAGWAQQQLEKINGRIEDPGDLRTYLQKDEHAKEGEARRRVEDAIESERCLQNLKDNGWVDPECIGANQRDKFDAGPGGTDAYINFVVQNAQAANRRRNERFANEYPGEQYHNVLASRGAIVNWLNQNSYLSEGVVSNVVSKAKSALGMRKKTNIQALENLHAKLDGWKAQGQITAEDEKDFFANLLKQFTNNPQAKQLADNWSVSNVSKVAGGMFNGVGSEMASGQAGKITPQELAAYKAKAPEIAKNLLNSAMKSEKKFVAKPSPSVAKAFEQAVVGSIQRMPNPRPATTTPQTTQQTPVR